MMKRLELNVGSKYRITRPDGIGLFVKIERITLSETGAVMVFFDIDKTPVSADELAKMFASGSIYLHTA